MCEATDRSPTATPRVYVAFPLGHFPAALPLAAAALHTSLRVEEAKAVMVPTKEKAVDPAATRAASAADKATAVATAANPAVQRRDEFAKEEPRKVRCAAKAATPKGLFNRAAAARAERAATAEVLPDDYAYHRARTNWPAARDPSTAAAPRSRPNSGRESEGKGGRRRGYQAAGRQAAAARTNWSARATTNPASHSAAASTPASEMATLIDEVAKLSFSTSPSRREHLGPRSGPANCCKYHSAPPARRCMIPNVSWAGSAAATAIAVVANTTAVRGIMANSSPLEHVQAAAKPLLSTPLSSNQGQVHQGVGNLDHFMMQRAGEEQQLQSQPGPIPPRRDPPLHPDLGGQNPLAQYQEGQHPGGLHVGGQNKGGHYPEAQYQYPGGHVTGGHFPQGHYPDAQYPGRQHPSGHNPGGLHSGSPFPGLQAPVARSGGG